MRNDYVNPDAPDPFITDLMVMRMKFGGEMTLPYSSGLSTEVPAFCQGSQIFTGYIDQPMWTASLPLRDTMYSMSPRNYLDYYSDQKSKPRTVSRDDKTGIITVHERNGRDVDVGDFKVTEAYFIDPDDRRHFKSFYCKLKTDGQEYNIIIPFHDFVRRDILKHLWMLLRNPDCPDKYIVIAFYLELKEFEGIKFFLTPEKSGWHVAEGKRYEFFTRGSVHPQLTEFYPADVQMRTLVQTQRALREISKEYLSALPVGWQYKLLIAIRIASLILYFLEDEGIKPDQIVSVEPASESAAKMAIALLKTQNYTSQSVMQLATAKPQELRAAMALINDGTFVVRDSALTESAKTSTAHAQVLADDMYSTDGKEEHARHINVIVADNPGNLSEVLPIMYISLTDKVCVGNPDKLQKLSGEFDTALIQSIMDDPTNNLSLIKDAISYSRIESETVVNSENYNLKRIILTGVFILKHYGLISDADSKFINQWLKTGHEENRESAAEIDNDFCVVYNSLIFNHIPVVPQFGDCDYRPGQLRIIAGKDFSHFEAGKVDRMILQHMTTTKKKNKMLHSLKEIGHLNCNNGYKSAIKVEITPGVYKTIKVYSIPNSILSDSNRERINEMASKNFLFGSYEAFKANLHKMVTNRSGTKISGQVYNQDTNKHQYIVGQSRFGKSKYITEQAVETAMHGEQVVIFDHNGSFTERELMKHLPSEIIKKYCSFWSVPKQGLPINLADLSNCYSLPEKKQRLKSIYAAGSRVLGSVQENVLNKKIGSMLKTKGDDVDIVNILDYFAKEGDKLKPQTSEFEKAQELTLLHSRTTATEKFGDKGVGIILDYLSERDKVEKSLRNRLEDIIEDLEDLPKPTATWGEFLSTQKQIVIISTGTDVLAKGSHLTDMMLASFYGYKQYTPDKHITVILDECQDLYLDTDGPIDIMLRKGGKHGIRMLLASQEFSANKDKLGKIIGNCGTLVFFRPKADNLTDIARLTGVEKSVLAELAQGQCVVYGMLYDKSLCKNRQFTLIGFTYNHKSQ